MINLPALDVMLQWDRIHTKIFNDEDVISGGIGYSF